MKINIKHARKIIWFLCEKTGLPTPMVKTIESPSIDSGVFNTHNLDIILTKDEHDTVGMDVVIHEWLHYALFLIQATSDGTESDDLEHRFIDMIVMPLLIGLLCLHPELGSYLNMGRVDDAAYQIIAKILSSRPRRPKNK